MGVFDLCPGLPIPEACTGAVVQPCMGPCGLCHILISHGAPEFQLFLGLLFSAIGHSDESASCHEKG